MRNLRPVAARHDNNGIIRFISDRYRTSFTKSEATHG